MERKGLWACMSSVYLPRYLGICLRLWPGVYKTSKLRFESKKIGIATGSVFIARGRLKLWNKMFIIHIFRPNILSN